MNTEKFYTLSFCKKCKVVFLYQNGRFVFRYTPLVTLGRYDSVRFNLDTLDYENKFSSLGMTEVEC